MKKFRLNRRTVIRGAGTIAIGLPWLECMTSEKKAEAQTASTAKRFVAVYQPGGTVRTGPNGDQYTPTGTDTAPLYTRPILAPLDSYKSKLNIIDGLNMSSAVGEQHQAGIIAFLTGTEQNTPNTVYAHGPSLDQVLASRISTGKPIRSLELAIRWATGKSHGRLHPINSLNFEDNTSFSPIPPRIDPQLIWDEIFGNIMTGGTPTNAEAIRINRKKSILDYVDRKYVALSTRLGAADRVRLEEHLAKVREIEMGLVPPEQPPSTCTPPTKISTTDYNPRSGLNSADDGSVHDTQTDAAIPKVGTFMMDMAVMALACDRTAVISLQWSDTEAKHTFPWLNLMDHHHFYQHDGGFRAAECAQIATWYSQMHAHLLQKMQETVMGPDNKTLLDESVVLFGSELQKPDLHQKDNMAFMLAGNGGGMRTGRWLKCNGQPHNNLLLSILRLYGDTRATFGNTKYSTGTLTGNLSLT
ncbi:MAG TPA: DUF1552 domain-containing protein [Polyangiaceae bacterium]